MLRVDREHPGTFLRGPAHEQRAGTDEAFLVGERNRSAPLDRGERRLEPGCPGDCRHDPIGGAPSRLDHGRRACRRFDPAPGKILLEVRIGAIVRHRREACIELARDPRQRPSIAVGADRLDPVARGVALEQIDGARADGSGGPQDRHAAGSGHGHGRGSGTQDRLDHRLTKSAIRARGHRSRRAPARARLQPPPRRRSHRADP